MKTYRVEYSAHAWQPRRRRQPMLPAEECQVIEHELEDGARLYVELAREIGSPPRVVIARISVPGRRLEGAWIPRTNHSLGADTLELVEVP